MKTFDFGPAIFNDAVLFRLWAPLQPTILIDIAGDRHEMTPEPEGWHQFEASGLGAGAHYKFVLPDGLEVPDPASHFQPDDVHGASEVIDLTSYHWQTQNWQGRPWEEVVLYELHIGAFTKDGTFKSAIERLDHLKDIGITAIQLMPISDFPGRYGWGYDGVLPYAPESSYGRPEDLMAFVDAAHARDICVFLDVVYNHFGPDGKYMPAYAPLFTQHHHTPWGPAINYDDEGSTPVREFVIQNAIYWITMFRLDGLRLDAVHEIMDDSEEHVLHELSRRVRQVAGSRHVHLVVENEDNDSELLTRDVNGAANLFTAQWNDDIHHVLHVAATDETFGYYDDYAHETHEKAGRALAEGFVFQGEHMPYRGETRGKASAHLPPTAFISFLQNHDQIGNRAHGDRVVSFLPLSVVKPVIALYLLAPQTPMLFMGEEWGAQEPFPYFCDFYEELNEKIRKGRRSELSRLPGFDDGETADPTALSTFMSAKLDWSKLGDARGSEMLDFYRQLLEIRRQHIVPLLKGVGAFSGKHRIDDNAIAVDWSLGYGARLHLLANLSEQPATIKQPFPDTQTIFSLGVVKDNTMTPWSIFWSISK